MKKLLAFLFIIFCVTLVMMSTRNADTSFFTEGHTQYFVSTQNIGHLPNYVEKIKNGDGLIITCDNKLCESFENTGIDYAGKTIVIDKAKHSIDNLLDRFEGKTINRQGDETFAYSSQISSFIIVEGKKVNLQFFENETKIYIGIPVLMGSY